MKQVDMKQVDIHIKQGLAWATDKRLQVISKTVINS